MKDFILFDITEKGVQGLNVEEIMTIVSIKKIGTYKLSIKKINGKISLPQNNYFHSIIKIISEFTGNEFYSEKANIKQMFFPKKKDCYGREIPVSTIELTKEQTSGIMDMINHWAFDWLNIILPTPEQWELIVL